jgi:hypothetical protein
MAKPARVHPCLLACGLTIAVSVAGCGLFHTDFDIAVGNRTANTVSVFVNGGKIGELGSNQTAAFTVEEPETGRTAVDSAGNPTSPIPVAVVTLAAQDMTTGVLSAGTSATLVKYVTTYVDVAPCGLLGDRSSTPCVSVSSVPIPPPTPACAFSLSTTRQSFDAAGGTGTVDVNTSSGCAWTATSSERWLTVTSGASGSRGELDQSPANGDPDRRGPGDHGQSDGAGRHYTDQPGLASRSRY